jgi:spore coat polysaccharide biosynthesis predicted glycosyltransferase SpsG
VSLYEAAAQGTPAVALAVVDAQRPTIRAFAGAGIAVDGGRLRAASAGAAIDRVARAVRVLVADPARQRVMARAGRRHVDGRGAVRVAAIIQSAFLARRSGDARAAGGA